jgi:hypothetical protein
MSKCAEKVIGLTGLRPVTVEDCTIGSERETREPSEFVVTRLTLFRVSFS